MGAEPQRLVLILGGARSGKSRWAETLASRDGRPVQYLATAATRPDDPSWCERLARHRRRRPPQWGCIETGAQLPELLEQLRSPGDPRSAHLLLIDSLGTWVAWHLEDGESQWLERVAGLLRALADHPAPVLLVGEEVGLGVVPPTAIGGLFRDRLGALQRALMPLVQESWLVVAGRALPLHVFGEPVPED